MSELKVSECLSDETTYCSGPYLVTIKNGMTINDWLKSKYVDVLKNKTSIFTGVEIKSMINNSSVLKEGCSSKVSLIDDDMLYTYYSTSMFELISSLKILEFSDGATYLDQLDTQVIYPNDTTILNDLFNENILILSGGNQICYVDTD